LSAGVCLFFGKKTLIAEEMKIKNRDNCLSAGKQGLFTGNISKKNNHNRKQNLSKQNTFCLIPFSVLHPGLVCAPARTIFTGQ